MCRLKVAQKVASRQFETQLEAGDKYTLRHQTIYTVLYTSHVSCGKKTTMLELRRTMHVNC